MKEIKIQTKNLALTALVSGQKTDPPVIALHGWLDNAASFTPIAQYLHGIQLFALDLPGHGKSEHRHGCNAYHFVDYAPDVLLAAKALGLEKFSLLGHSLGAGISCLLAAGMPECVERVALIDGLAPFSADDDQFPAQYRKHLENTLESGKSATIYPSIETAAKARMSVSDLSLQAAMLIAERSLIAVEGGFTWRSDRNVNKTSPIYLTENHIQSYLNRVECETMLIRTEKGIIKNWDRLKGREPYVKDLIIVDVEGKHHCHMEEPEQIASQLLPFFTR